MGDEEKEGAARKEGRPWGAAVFAVFFYLLDAQLLNQGVMSGLIGFASGVYLLFGGVAAALTGRLGSFRPLRAGILLLMAASVIGSNLANNRIARGRALGLAAACESYRESRGYYPAGLEELVPEFLPAVPRAKYTLGFNKFQYFGHNIMYTAMPPFGRPYYSLDEKKWKYMD